MTAINPPCLSLCVVFLVLTAAAIPQKARAAGPDPNACDGRLGAGYDRLSPEDKAARLQLYFDCRQAQDLSVLQQRHWQMQMAVQAWAQRGNLVSSSSLNTQRSGFDAELAASQASERTQLTAQYNSRLAALNAGGGQSQQDLSAARRDATLTFRQSQSDMNARHTDGRRVLRDSFQQCAAGVLAQIEGMAADDLASLNAQFVDKSTRLRAGYRNLAGTPVQMSVRQHMASQGDADAAASRQAAPAGNDAPIGAVQDVTGDVTITRPSGEAVSGTVGTAIYQDDVVTTGTGATCKLIFLDESEIQIPENAMMQIDEYVFDPPSDDGQGTSWLRSLFIFTSNLIGRKEVEDVNVDMPIGSIGTRG